ncbi:hypothetical protein [Saliphagus sp. LR7]|uniref:hypothetical protein n=1 Tax=Saliphagus sp. LR7 TaxID=2282654 RepID=UPI0013001C04|nr:hypothetical protein [Saliphagus sp. LR7]
MTLVALLVTVSVIASLGVAPFLVLGDNGSSDAPTENESGIEADGAPVGDDEGDEGDADGTGADAFDGEEFIGESVGDSEGELSEEEKAAHTYEIFSDLLTENGYEITGGEMNDGIIHIEYRTYAEDRGEINEEIGDISGLYAIYDDILQNELSGEYEGQLKEQTTGFHVTIVDYNDVEQGSFSVEGDWARAYYAEEISAEEYGERVTETVEISNNFDEESGTNDNSSD